MQESILPNQDALCSLNANQQFRLCCVVQDLLKISEKREFYYSMIYDHACLEQQIVRNYEDVEENRKKYLSADIRTNAIICTFEENQIENTFYLTIDPRDESAVFVLVKSSSSENEMYVSGYVSNVAVMEYAKKVY